MVVLIIGLLLIIIVGWLLFMPLVVEVDTDRARYQVVQRGTFRFWISSDFQPHLRVIGISVPLKSDAQKKLPNKKLTTKTKSKRQLHPRSLIDLLKRIYKSISVNWFYLDLDTDDVLLNAQLVPSFLLVSKGPIHLTTNFEGRVYASLRAEIKLYRIGWAFLLFHFKKYNYGNEF